MNNMMYPLLIIITILIVATLVLLKRSLAIKKQIIGYQNIFKHTNDALMLIDIMDGKILYANTGAENLLGYSIKQLCTKTIFDLHEKEQLAKSSETIAKVYEQKGLIYTDLPFINSAGEKIAVECSANVEDFAGKPAIFISARDIRERLRMETQIKAQNTIIEQKNKDLIDSITYAQNIQHAILPSLQVMQQSFPNMFVLYYPKDIVSGDFYWHTSLKTSVKREYAPANSQIDVIAVVDCTGHGVPGAFMSLVGHTLLNQTVNNSQVNSPAEEIGYIHKELVNMLNKKKEEVVVNDGMDMSVCAICRDTMKLVFAGANHTMYHVRKGKLTAIKGDKQAIGIQSAETFKPYTNHLIDIEKGDAIYMFSDGFADQFGGARGKKYRSSQMQEFLLRIEQTDMEKQRELLYNEYIQWKGTNEQVDDVLVLGIRI